MTVQANASLRNLSYYKTGGTCRTLYLPKNTEECAAAMADIATSGAPLLIIGGGTNSLVTDEYWDGAVIGLHHMIAIEERDGRLICEGGVENTGLAKFALERNLAGVEFMNRLPGQIGGTVRMNARCYGGEMSQVVTGITTVTREGSVRLWQSGAVFRGYKDTVFMENGHLVVACEFSLVPGDRAEIAAKMRYCEEDRIAKHQFDFPSCGCVYKNDYQVGVSSGVLLEKAGVKTFTVGGASVSPWHANFVFNRGATARDILVLTLKMRDAVWDSFGVWLEYEMELLGNAPPDLVARVKERRPHAMKLDLLEPLREEFARPKQKISY